MTENYTLQEYNDNPGLGSFFKEVRKKMLVDGICDNAIQSMFSKNIERFLTNT